jgi:hypothetical protein
MSMDTPEPRPVPEPTRVTPYELAFGEAGSESRLFSAIEAEMESVGVDASHFDQFSMLRATTRAVHELVPAETPSEAAEQHRSILFHAFNFWRFGRRLYLLEPAAARYLVEAAPVVSGEDLAVPYRALYVQLPANLFWASIAPDVPPEPVDGYFVTAAPAKDTHDAPFVHLYALMVLGIRRNRAGFSVIPLEAEIGSDLPLEWLNVPGREAGRDFDNLLPGGELTGMYSILTTVEALKLLMRALGYIVDNADEVTWEDAMELRADDRPGSVRFSRLPFYRVTLRGDTPQACGA